MPPNASTSAEATETSPLLPKHGVTLPSLALLEDPIGAAEHSTGVLQRIVSGEDVENGTAGDDGNEGGEGGEGEAAQYQGVPEVKKQLKYIIPSVAIGVRSF